MQRVKRGGAKLMCFAPALVLAKKLVRSGADAIVIEGMVVLGSAGGASHALAPLPARRCGRRLLNRGQ